MISIEIKKLREGARIPERATSGSAGMDLRASIDTGFTLIEPGEWKMIPTGIAIQLPESTDEKMYFGGVYSRSGLARKNGIHVLNAPGVIDEDYTGEIGVILKNDSKVPFKVCDGDKIAQLIIHEIVKTEFKEVTEFSRTTERGEGGFGHTGK